MEVKDKIRVLGRGWVFIVEPTCEINIPDKVICGENKFEIAGIERLSFVKKIGLVLLPNDIACKTINIGDNIIINNISV